MQQKNELIIVSMIAIVAVLTMILLPNSITTIASNNQILDDSVGQATIIKTTSLKSDIGFYEPEYAAEIDDGTITPDNLISGPAPSSSINEEGAIKTLVILVNFADSPPGVPFTKEQAYDLIFNGGAQQFIKEVSYEKQHLQGAVYGWYDLPIENGSDCHILQYEPATGKKYYQQILETIPNLENYEYITFLVDNNGCDMIHAWTIGKLDIFVNNITYTVGIQELRKVGQIYNIQWEYNTFPYTQLDQSFIHELGHSFGLFHSNTLECAVGKRMGVECLYDMDCSDAALCEEMNYGNRYDSMGNGRFSLHYSAWQKERLGWLSDTDIIIINKSGTYTINNLENNLGKRAAKIIIPTLGEMYYIEYRTPVLLDRTMGDPPINNNNQGIFIYRRTKNPYFQNQGSYLLLDMSPNERSTIGPYSDWFNSSLNTGVFYDESINLTIGPIINKTNNSITFKVVVPDSVCKEEVILKFKNIVYKAGDKIEIGEIYYVNCSRRVYVQLYVQVENITSSYYSDFEIINPENNALIPVNGEEFILNKSNTRYIIQIPKLIENITVIRFGAHYINEKFGSFSGSIDTAYGALYITPQPNDTKTYIDGQYRGISPLTVTGLTVGNHTLRLTKSGYSDYYATKYIYGYITNHISPQLQVSAPLTGTCTATPTSGKTPLKVNFKATATGGSTTYAAYGWDFLNNGQTNTQGNTSSYVYKTAGTYSPKVTIYDSNGQQTTISCPKITAGTIIKTR